MLKKQSMKDLAQEIAGNSFAVSLHISRFGHQKSYSRGEKAKVAEATDTSEENTFGGFKLYARNDPYIKRITSALGELLRQHRALTVDYPEEKGWRLIKKERLAEYEQMAELMREELNDALEDADRHYSEIMDNCRAALTNAQTGKCRFDQRDYPASFVGCVNFKWGVKNYQPDPELMKLAPQTYDREVRRLKQSMAAAVVKFEEESRSELAKLVDSLLRLTQDPKNGKRMCFSNAVTNNLRTFFDRCKQMDMIDDDDLQELIDDAEAALGNTTAQTMKVSKATRNDIADTFGKLKTALAENMEAAPERSIDLDDLDD